jgi:hypothetical protein
VGGQWSSVYANKTSSYHPPIIAAYSGASHLARTDGGQAVVISGKSMGPAGTTIDAATYGSDENATTFTASNCSLLTPHMDVLCYTAVGAGAGLKWRLTIDGQLSVTPATDYGPPIITSYTGRGAADASTDGGDDVYINGDFLSVQRFLDKVTYGPSGSEYNPTPSCNVSVPHRQIRCTTLPGHGRRHSWFVTVGGQTSALGTVSTSYALPQITRLTPAFGYTSGVGVVLNGTDLGVCPPSGASTAPCNQPSIVVKFNDGTAGDRPPQGDIDAHYAAVAAGSPAGYKASVLTWLARMQTLLPTAFLWYGRSLHGLQVALPQGYGINREVIVVVGGVLSNIALFNYSRPALGNLAPDRQGVPHGYLRVQVDGSSFCNLNLQPACGDILVDGVSVLSGVLAAASGDGSGGSTKLWRHDYIAFAIPEPGQGGGAKQVTVVVGGQASDPRSFLRPVPNINALSTQGTWNGLDTVGGDIFYISGVMDITGETIRISIGGRDCRYQGRVIDNGLNETNPQVSYRVYCITPPGVGSAELNPVVISSETGNSSTATSLRVQYMPPRLDAITISQPFASPADAAALIAAVAASGGARGLATHAPDDEGMSAVEGLFPWVGSAAAARALQAAGAATTPRVPTLGALVVLAGRFLGQPTAGGDPFVMVDADGRIGECAILARNDSMLIATLPPGDGVGHYVWFRVGNQWSNQAPFAYSPPTAVAVSPAHGPTDGRGVSLTLTGFNFGTSPNAVVRSQMPYVQVGGRNCTITSPLPHVNHSSITCTLPPGQGVNLPVTVWVNGQLSTDPAAASTATFSYDPPAVSSIAPTSGPTSGRTHGVYLDASQVYMSAGDRIVMVLRGDNLGSSGAITFEPTEASAPLTAKLAVPFSDVLSMPAFNALLARANGSLDTLAGMSIADADLATFEAVAAASANSNGAASSANGTSSSASGGSAIPRMWNDSAIVFLMPQGFGTALRVNVSVEQAGSSGALFGFNGPQVDKVVNANFDNEKNKCVPRWENSSLGYRARERGALPRLKLTYPGCYSTNGGYTLLLVGQSFGPQAQLGGATVVTVGDRVCNPVVQRTEKAESGHNYIFCIAPAGIGMDLPVVVSVGGRPSAVQNATRFSYDPPEISGFDPNNPDALGIPRLGVKGSNLGDVPTPTRLLLNDKECGAVDLKGSDYLFCSPQADVVGSKNISLLIANRTEPALYYDVEELLV